MRFGREGNRAPAGNEECVPCLYSGRLPALIFKCDLALDNDPNLVVIVFRGSSPGTLFDAEPRAGDWA
jgi:hypothetical protein